MSTRVTSDFKLYTGEINESGYIEEPETTLNQELLETGTTDLTLQSTCADTGLKIDWDKPFVVNMYFKLPSSAIGTTVFLFGESDTGFRAVTGNTTINGGTYFNVKVYSPSNSILAEPAVNGAVTGSNISSLVADTGYYFTFEWNGDSRSYTNFSATISTESFYVSSTSGNNIYSGGQDSTMSGISTTTLKMFQPTTSSSYPAFYSHLFKGMSTGENDEQEKEVDYINPSFGDTVSCTRIVENQYLNLNNKTYLKIFSHDIRDNKSMFKNSDDAKFNVASANRFSRLEDIPLFTSNSSTQVGVSGIQSRVNGTDLWFSFGNEGSKDVVCNIKVVLTKNDGTEDTLQYNGFNIEAKKMYYVQLPETTYNYANIYFDDDYDYFIWSSSFSQGFYLTYGWGKSEDILFQIGNKLNYLIPSYTSLGISENDFWLVDKPKYEFLLNYNRLPSAYEELEYIETTGTQYIDTGYTPNYATVIEGKFKHTEGVADTPLFGVRKSDYSNSYTYWTHPSEYTAGYNAVIFNGTQIDFSQKYPVGTIEEFYYSNSKIRIMNEIHTLSPSVGTPGLNLMLLGLSNGGSIDSRKFIGYLYSFIIKDDETTVRNFIPAKRKSDNVVGLYDLIYNKFYTSNGSEQFIGGPIASLYNVWSQSANPLNTDADSTQTLTTMNYSNLDINMSKYWKYGMGLSTNSNTYLDCQSGNSLPKGYIRLEYIEGTGTQYIDTGYGSSSGIRTIYKACFNSSGYIVGSHALSSPYGRNSGYLYSNGTWEFGYGDAFNRYGNGSFGITYEVDFKTTYSDAYIKVKGGSYSDWTTLATSSGQTINSLNNLIFYNQYTQNSGGNCTSALVYYVKIYNSSGVLVRDFIPSLEISTNEIGLYDLVNNKFYKNSGSGEFKTNMNNYFAGNIGQYNYIYSTPGGVLQDLPNGYTKLSYLQSSGTQFINTGITSGDNITQIDADYYQDSNASKQILFGMATPSDSHYSYIGYCENDYVERVIWYNSNNNSDANTGVSFNVGRKRLSLTINGTSFKYILNDNTYTSTSAVTPAGTTPYYLFGDNSGGTFIYGGKLKLYSFKIWVNNILARNFIPVLKNSSQEIGLYDTVTKNFYTNNGTGEFIGGLKLPKYFIDPNGNEQAYVGLYTRIDNVNGWTGKASIRNNKCIFMDEFIEE